MNNIYISDLDKTLLRSDLSLSNYTKKIWNILSQEGIKLTIATARSGMKSLELLKDLRLEYPLIVMDGAMIIDSKGRAISSFFIDRKTAQEILETGKRYGLLPFVIGVDDFNVEKFLYPSKLNVLQKELINQYKNDKRLQEQKNILPLKESIKIVYIGQKDNLIGFKEEIESIFGDELEVKFSKDPYLDGYFLTFLHSKGDKAHALKNLIAMDDFQGHKITVFGDNHNDIGMFKVADQKVAVLNALDELKSIATEILPYTNDEDGVANYLYKKYFNILDRHI